MPGPGECPDAQTLRDFLLGLLDFSPAEEVTQHLEGCSRCLSAVRGLGPVDPLVSALRRAPAIVGEPLPGAVASLMGSMYLLRPQAEPRKYVPPPPPFLAPPRVAGDLGALGPYRLRRELGRGGMGIVYLAEDTDLHRQVALKVMQPELAAHEVSRQRFLREARAAAAVQSDHVVTIYQVNEDNGIPYMVMPLLQGETLSARLRREKPLPVAEALRIAREIAMGLAAAHEHGLVHRDVKPANIWLESRGEGGSSAGAPGSEAPPPRIKLLDFGLAWVADANLQLTPPEVVIGTPAYLAPEMLSGDTMDGRCDLFSLGCVLFEMLTGKLAFGGSTPAEMLKALSRETPPPPPHEVNPAVPPWLSTFVLQLLARDKDSRPASARAVVIALQAISGGLATVPGVVAVQPPAQPAAGAPGCPPTLPGVAPSERPKTLPAAPAAERRRTHVAGPAATQAEAKATAAPPPKPAGVSLSTRDRNVVQTVDEFCELFRRSRLLAADQVDAAAVAWRRETPAATGKDVSHFTNWLVKKQYVTEYQAAQMLRGHANHFFLNQYKILDRIGQGRMAGVYKAVHELGQLVAVKVLPPSKLKDKETFGRFQREARLAMQLKHPNIVRTFEVGQAGEGRYHYLVMEYLDGETLEELLKRRGKLPPHEAARLLYQALLGLQHIYDKGMVHRDIKPANLMLVNPAGRDAADTSQATVKILDIGLGRAYFDEAGVEDPQLTNNETVLGTPEYRAPEASINSHTADIRADIYALGCTLFHALAGQPLFPDESPVRQMLLHAKKPPPRLRDFNAEVSDGLQQVVDRMLAKDPAQRPAHPDEAAQALQPFVVQSYQPAPLERDPRFLKYLEWLEESPGEPAPNAAPAWEPASVPDRAARPPRPPDIKNTPPPEPKKAPLPEPKKIPPPEPKKAPPEVKKPRPALGSRSQRPAPPTRVAEQPKNQTPLFWLGAGCAIGIVSLLLGAALAWIFAHGMHR